MSSSHSRASRIPIKPISIRLAPTAISSTFDAPDKKNFSPSILFNRFLSANAIIPSNVADTP